MADKPQEGFSPDFARQMLERARSSRPKDEPPAAPAPAAPEPEKKGPFLTSSVFGRSNIQKVADSGGKAIEAITKVLPAKLHGKWMDEFLQEAVAQGGAEMLDFISSPIGIGLLGAHVSPITAPIAAIGDLAFSGTAALQAVPDAVKLVRGGWTPKDAAKLAFDLFAAHGLSKAGKAKIREGFTDKPAGFNEKVIRETSALPEQRMKLAALESAVPKTKREARLQKISKNPFTGNIAALAGVPLPTLESISKSVIEDRNATLSRVWLESKWHEHFLKREVPVAERDIEKMGYVLEGTHTPEQVGLGPKAKEWVEKLREHRKRSDELLQAAYGGDLPLGDAEHYVTHIWDFGKNPDGATRAARTLMRDPFWKPRSVNTLAEGIKSGLTPKFRDIADVMRVRDEFAAKAAANMRMSRTLRGLGVVLSEEEYGELGLGGWNQARQAHALDRAVYLRTEPAGPKGGKPEVIMGMRPVRVHPDFESAVAAVFDEQHPNKFWSAVETIRSVEKKMRLNFSFFHHHSLTEQAHALDITRGWDKPVEQLKTLGKDIWVLNPQFQKGIRAGLWDLGQSETSNPVLRKIGQVVGKDSPPPIFQLNPEELRPWIDASLQVRPPAEAESIVSQKIANLAQGLKLGGEESGSKVGQAARKATGKLLQPMADVMHVWDKGLWEFYHQGQMINQAESIFGDELNRAVKSGKSLSPEETTELRRNVASHANDAFGAVNYQNLLQSPTAIRALNFLVLAPAWTLSNIRIMAQAFENETGLRLATRWAKGAAVSWFLTTQLLNYGMTKYYGMEDKNGKKGGHFTWDNPGSPMRFMGKLIHGLSENGINVGAGYNYDEQGNKTTQRYMKLGRAFREPFLWMLDPVGTLGSKAGQLPRQMGEFVTGHSPGGYEVVNLSGQRQGHQMPPGHETAQRMSLVAGQMVPMVAEDARRKAQHYLFPDAFPKVTGSQQFGGFPTSAGITVSKATQAYLDAMDNGENDAATEVLNAAAQNNINPAAVLKLVRRELTRRAKEKAMRQPAPPGAR